MQLGLSQRATAKLKNPSVTPAVPFDAKDALNGRCSTRSVAEGPQAPSIVLDRSIQYNFSKQTHMLLAILLG